MEAIDQAIAKANRDYDAAQLAVRNATSATMDAAIDARNAAIAAKYANVTPRAYDPKTDDMESMFNRAEDGPKGLGL